MFNSEAAPNALSLAPVSWWFWIKAGLGLSVGVGIASLAFFIIQFYLIGPVNMLFLKAIR